MAANQIDRPGGNHCKLALKKIINISKPNTKVGKEAPTMLKIRPA